MTVLTDKVAIVTASSAIGRATALLFAREGAKLVVTARRQSELDKLVAEIEQAGGEVVAVASDVKDEALAKASGRCGDRSFRRARHPFNNAGVVGEMKPVSELSLAEWRDTLDTNLTSAFRGAKYQVPAMIARGGGSLILPPHSWATRSVCSAWQPMPPARRGQIGLVKSLAAEFGAQGIRANAILPGGTDTRASITNTPGATVETLTFVEVFTPTSVWRRPRRLRDLCFISHPMHRASSPEPPSWSMAVFRSIEPDRKRDALAQRPGRDHDRHEARRRDGERRIACGMRDSDLPLADQMIRRDSPTSVRRHRMHGAVR